jgi:hypothetical protein
MEAGRYGAPEHREALPEKSDRDNSHDTTKDTSHGSPQGAKFELRQGYGDEVMQQMSP